MRENDKEKELVAISYICENVVHLQWIWGNEVKEKRLDK